jgi:hypothetical protein
MSVKVWMERIRVLDIVLRRENKAAAGVLEKIQPRRKGKKSHREGGERRAEQASKVGRTQSSIPGIGG